MASPDPPVVSVIVVNWNTSSLLRQCLRALQQNVSDRVRLEIIVVDNGSTDDSRAMLEEEEFRQVRTVALPSNVGYVRGVTAGLAAATGDFVMLLNSDTEVRPGAVERLVEVVAGDPHIGFAGPALLNSDGTPQVSVMPFWRLSWKLLPSHIEHALSLRRYEQMLRQPGPVRRVDWITGAVLILRRDALDRLGPLDERLFMWYDDLDWALRARKLGRDRVWVEDAQVVHHGRQSAARLDNVALELQILDSEYTVVRLHWGRAGVSLLYLQRMAKLLVRLLVGRPAARERLRSLWRYHRRNLARFCLSGQLRASPPEQETIPSA